MEWGMKRNSFRFFETMEEDRADEHLPSIQEPQTPKDSMEFLSRSWSISSTDVSRAFVQKQKQFYPDPQKNEIRENIPQPIRPINAVNSLNVKRTGSIGRWFNHKDNNASSAKKKDKARMENARMHASLSVAALAAAIAAVALAENSDNSKMSTALASATELLASHCIEMAEAAGVDHDRVASVVKSAVDVQSPSHIVTLTAAAATALRGETALKARAPKEPKKNATVSPCDKPIEESPKAVAIQCEMEPLDSPLIGELLQYAQGGLRCKHVSVYVNKKSQVMIKMKSKQVGGAFTKKNKCIVYAVCDEPSKWSCNRERENIDCYFGVKTAEGLLEFKCKNEINKQKWVKGINSLFH